MKQKLIAGFLVAAALTSGSLLVASDHEQQQERSLRHIVSVGGSVRGESEFSPETDSEEEDWRGWGRLGCFLSQSSSSDESDGEFSDVDVLRDDPLPEPSPGIYGEDPWGNLGFLARNEEPPSAAPWDGQELDSDDLWEEPEGHSQ